jgi:hypothetical protein
VAVNRSFYHGVKPRILAVAWLSRILYGGAVRATWGQSAIIWAMPTPGLRRPGLNVVRHVAPRGDNGL